MLTRYLDANFLPKFAKCQWAKPEVKFFGRMVSKDGVGLDAQKLLDTDEEYNGTRGDVKKMSFERINMDEYEREVRSQPGFGQVEVDRSSVTLNKVVQWSPKIEYGLKNGDGQWLRAIGTFKCSVKEWDVWKMTQMIVRFQMDDHVVKERSIRVQRLLNDAELKEIWMDVKVPPARKPFNKVVVLFWNAGGDKEIEVSKLGVETFNER